MQEAAEHAPDDWGGQWFHNLRAGPRAPHDRQETGNHRADRHDLWSQPQHRTLDDSGLKVLKAESHAFFLPLLLQGFFQVDNHDHTGLNRGSEESNVADPDRHAEVVSQQILKKRPTGKRKRDCQDDMGGLHDRTKNHRQQHENDEKNDRHDQCQRSLSAKLALILSAPLQSNPRRKINSLSDALLEFSHKSPEIPAMDVALHKDAEQPILTGDLAGAA